MPNALTLFELTQLIREVVETSFSRTYWVTAELSDVAVRGHCYMELLQKGVRGDAPVAKCRANIWQSTWWKLKAKFERATGQPLSSGMKVMLEVRVTFHEVYGFSLNVVDIDPTYTLGDIAKRRQEIIDALKQQGIFDDNRSLELPRLLNRIAVISAEGAAGYGDFCNQLDNNPYGLRFTHRLFQAKMQGSEVEPTVIAALGRIYEELDDWDVVVIIRGGGSTSDLSGFDSLPLAEHVAQFPLPVITGIGHERDNTVIDEIAHTRVKTPTAAAEFLINHQHGELTCLEEMEQTILSFATNAMTDATNRLGRVTDKLPTLFQLRKEKEQHRQERLINNLTTAIRSHKIEMMASVVMIGEQLNHARKNLLNNRRNQLQLIESKLEGANPEKILRLGFSISRLNGKALTDTKKLRAGDQIVTTLANGAFVSTVNEAPPPSDEQLRRQSPFNIGKDTYMA